MGQGLQGWLGAGWGIERAGVGWYWVQLPASQPGVYCRNANFDSYVLSGDNYTYWPFEQNFWSLSSVTGRRMVELLHKVLWFRSQLIWNFYIHLCFPIHCSSVLFGEMLLELSAIYFGDCSSSKKGTNPRFWGFCKPINVFSRLAMMGWH